VSIARWFVEHDVNVSVAPYSPYCATIAGRSRDHVNYLQPGRQQVAAGYAIYARHDDGGHRGQGTHGFTLDREIGNFILTHPNLEFPPTPASCDQHQQRPIWEPPVHRYVTECQAGKTGDRARDFNMRLDRLAGREVHRILMRGGVFSTPRTPRTPASRGGCACCTRRTPSLSSSSRPAAAPRRATSACSRHAGIAASAGSADLGLPQRSGTNRALPRRARLRQGSSVHLAAVHERSMFRPERRL